MLMTEAMAATSRAVGTGLVVEDTLRAMAQSDSPLEALRLGQQAEEAMHKAGKQCPKALTRAVDDLAALCVWKERSTAGFPGAILTVRPPPVEKAWMGAQAGPDPDQDDPAFYGNEDCVDARAPLLALPAVTGGPVPAMTAGVTTVARPWSYRCLADAVRAASDGDTIILLQGTHPSGSRPEDEAGIHVNKRVLIRGQGRVVLEHRANSPLLRFSRGAVIKNLAIDMVGFRECVRCEGGASPLFLDVELSSSGGDALHVTGGSRPVLVGCTIKARKGGVRAWKGDTTGRPVGACTKSSGSCTGIALYECTVTDCEGAGVAVHGGCELVMHSCVVKKTGEEGLLLMGSASAHISQTSIRDCKGPAIDASGTSQVVLQQCTVEGSGGGVWLWDSSTAMVHGPGRIESKGRAAVVADPPAKTTTTVAKHHKEPTLLCGACISAHGAGPDDMARCNASQSKSVADSAKFRVDQVLSCESPLWGACVAPPCPTCGCVGAVRDSTAVLPAELTGVRVSGDWARE